jgi:hypothetical protein
LVQVGKLQFVVVDANGKLNAGVLKGNIHQLGSYDECLDVRVEKKGDLISGQYCSVYLEPKDKRNEHYSGIEPVRQISSDHRVLN